MPFWLDTPDRPAARPPLGGDITCDLAVVGGGFSGLWTALIAKQTDPTREVVLLEGGRLAWAATGRNGGFCAASITHGYANGMSRWPDEMDTLERLGMDNLDAIEATIQEFGIDCDWERTGEIDVATQQWQLEGLDEQPGVEVLDADAVRAHLNSPTFVGGVWDRRGVGMVDPARLAWGLADAAESLGVRIVETTPVRRLTSGPSEQAGVTLDTDHGTVTAQRVALGTNVFRSLIPQARLFTVPVYDYVLMTEPLSDEQLARIGWQGRQGFGDCGNQFHYFRLTRDNRILWGGYDAVYFYGGGMGPQHDQRAETFDKLAEHFASTFPQLPDVRFSHCWGGAIDTCTRFSAFFGTAHGGRVAYAAGFTGLGVGATRFGAQVMLDLLDGRDTERTRLQMVQRKPIPFPPEPFAYAGIELTRRALAHADRNEGHRNLWLRTLDRLGLGFDS